MDRECPVLCAALNAGTDSNQTYHSGGGVPFATYFNQCAEDASMGWDQLLFYQCHPFSGSVEEETGGSPKFPYR